MPKRRHGSLPAAHRSERTLPEARQRSRRSVGCSSARAGRFRRWSSIAPSPNRRARRAGIGMKATVLAPALDAVCACATSPDPFGRPVLKGQLSLRVAHDDPVWAHVQDRVDKAALVGRENAEPLDLAAKRLADAPSDLRPVTSTAKHRVGGKSPRLTPLELPTAP